jgi:DivIVA domain-containing protein
MLGVVDLAPIIYVVVMAFLIAGLGGAIISLLRSSSETKQATESPASVASARRLSVDDLRSVSFPSPPPGKRGYNAADVDSLLERAEHRLIGRSRMTATDVREARFDRPPLFQRGYDQDDVDELLDRIAAIVADMELRGR